MRDLTSPYIVNVPVCNFICLVIICDLQVSRRPNLRVRQSVTAGQYVQASQSETADSGQLPSPSNDFHY